MVNRLQLLDYSEPRTHSYFGHDGWERDAPGLKTFEDALEIRRRVLVAYEATEREPDAENRARNGSIGARRQ